MSYVFSYASYEILANLICLGRRAPADRTFPECIRLNVGLWHDCCGNCKWQEHGAQCSWGGDSSSEDDNDGKGRGRGRGRGRGGRGGRGRGGLKVPSGRGVRKSVSPRVGNRRIGRV